MSPSIPHHLNSLSSHSPVRPSAISSHFTCVELVTTNFVTFSTLPSRLTFFQCLEFWQMLSILLTSIPHMLKIPHIFLTLKFIAKNDLLYFLAFSNVRKGFLTFPHPVVNFLTFCMCGTGSNEFPHILPRTRPKLENQTKNSLHFSNVWDFGKHSILTSIPHIRKNSSLFPHIFLTLKFHGVLMAVNKGAVKKKIAPTATKKERGEEAPMPRTVRGLPQR